MDLQALLGKQNMEGVHAPELPEDVGPWLNSEPLNLKQLQAENKVVLIDIWTYTCVNCLRTLPYLKKWWDEYQSKGLVIIGVHTPEFEFEKDFANVKEAVEALEISYPVVLDNDFKIWNAFANHYWPRKYLIDTKGIIVYDHSGEGDYIDTEQAIRKELARQIPGLMFTPLTTEEHHHNEGAVCYPMTNETYCGYARGNLGNDEGFVEDRVGTYKAPPAETYQDATIYLNGEWEATPEYVRHASANLGFIGLGFHGTEVNFVAKNTNTDQRRVYITLDGAPLPADMAGDDVIVEDDGTSFINVTIPKMYQLIKSEDYGEHTLQLTTKSDQFQIYAFTFGGCTQ